MSAQWSGTEKEREREEGRRNVLTRIWKNEPFNWFRIVLNNSRKSQCHSKTFVKAFSMLKSLAVRLFAQQNPFRNIEIEITLKHLCHSHSHSKGMYKVYNINKIKATYINLNRVQFHDYVS